MTAAVHESGRTSVFGFDDARASGALVEVLGRAVALPAYASEYAKVLQPGDSLVDSFFRLPLVHKEDLIQNASTEDPYGGRLGVSRAELANVFVAPGPIYAPYTRRDLDAVAASFAWAFASCGLTSSDVVDQTTMYNWVIAATVLDAGLRKLGCAIVPGGIGDSERHLEVLASLQIEGIVAFPTFLEHLLKLAAERGVRLPLRSAAVMGELQDPDAKARILRDHGLEVREFYATGEVGVVAAECGHSKGMHLRPGIIIEFLDPITDQPVQPSPGHPAQLVITEFARQAMPMVRYATGDLIDEIYKDRCACGASSPRVGQIVGRVGDIAKVKGMFLAPKSIANAMAGRGLFPQFQVVVDREVGEQDSVSVLIAQSRPESADEIVQAIEGQIRMRVAVEWDAQLAEGAPLLDDKRVSKTST